MTQNDFAFRIDRWTDDGERIVEDVAGVEDFQIAMATYHAARKRYSSDIDLAAGHVGD